MNDDRSDEQKTADTALDEAVRGCVAAYFGSGLVTDYAVVLHQFDTDATGTEDHDHTVLLLPHGGHDMPAYRVIGLLRAGQIEVEGVYGDGGDG